MPGRRPARALLGLAVLLAGGGLLTTGGSTSAAAPGERPVRVSRPLVDTARTASPASHGSAWRDRSGGLRERENPRLPSTSGPASPSGVQASAGTTAAALGAGFDGLGLTDNAFSVRYAPPDTNGDVSATQYVQSVNTQFAVYDLATRKRAAAPFFGSSLFEGFTGTGAACAEHDDGDPIVQYDRRAGRWLLTQFQVTETPYLECIAVSDTSDATGSYHLYAYAYGTDFVDYPKVSVWPGSYLVTYNVFANGQTFTGGEVCALDRTALLAGSPGHDQECLKLGTSYGGLLTSDDDATNPPAGDAYMVAMVSGGLRSWRLHPDFSAGGTLGVTGPSTVSGVAAFSPACGGGGNCIPQKSSGTKLDSLGDRLMYRLAYQEVGTQPHLVVTHAVTVPAGRKTSTGVRWYDLVPAGTGLSVGNQGTYAPDATHRWMSSAAMNKAGGIAVGYSASSSSMYPAIRVASRLAGDPAGTLGTEQVLMAGKGSQSGSGLTRWGDYSSMSLAPDGCTMWFTSEYLTATGAWNWSTRISSVALPGC